MRFVACCFFIQMWSAGCLAEHNNVTLILRWRQRAPISSSSKFHQKGSQKSCWVTRSDVEAEIRLSPRWWYASWAIQFVCHRGPKVVHKTSGLTPVEKPRNRKVFWFDVQVWPDQLQFSIAKIWSWSLFNASWCSWEPEAVHVPSIPWPGSFWIYIL